MSNENPNISMAAGTEENNFWENFFCFQNIMETMLRWWKLIAVLAVIGGIIGVVYVKCIAKPVYSSSATVFSWRVEQESGTRFDMGNAYRDLTAALLLINDYVEILKSHRLLNELNTCLLQEYHASWVGNKIVDNKGKTLDLRYDLKISNAQDSRILVITATAHDPKVSAYVANETTRIFEGLLREVLEFSNVKLVDKASDGKLTNKKLSRGLPIGVFSGGVLGAAIAMIIALCDQTVKTPEEAERYFKRPVIGVIAKIPDADLENRSMLDLLEKKGFNDLAESLRMCRTNLPLIAVADDNNPCRVFLMTSTIAGEGKSSTASCLAKLTNSSGKRVLLIDGDLRNPTLHRIFNVDAGKGLVSVLSGEAKVQDVLVKLGENFDLLPCGAPPPNPAELLMSQHMPKMLEEMRKQYDYIFIDSTPSLFLADPMVLIPYADAVLYTISCGGPRIGMVRKAMQFASNAAGNMPLAILLNRKPAAHHGYGYYHYSGKYGYGKYGYGRRYGYGYHYGYGNCYSYRNRYRNDEKSSPEQNKDKAVQNEEKKQD